MSGSNPLESTKIMNNYEFKSAENIDFNKSDIAPYSSFTQSDIFEQWQNHIGYKSKKFVVYKENKIVAFFYLYHFPLIFGQEYVYLPYGPVSNDDSDDFLSAIKDFFKKYSRDNKVAFVRFDFMPIISSQKLNNFFTKTPQYAYHSAHLQPRTEWYLNIQDSEENLIANMHKNTRYSIRSAEKRGIEVEIVTENFRKYFQTFYELMEITASRNGFQLHPKKYYEGVFETMEENKTSHFLSIARYKDKILAISLIINHEKIANYVFGCSDNIERNRFPAYLGLWKAILHAKSQGSVYFNFGAISDENSNAWESLTRFKKKFGGEEIQHSDFFDLVTNHLFYFLFNLRKKLRNH